MTAAAKQRRAHSGAWSILAHLGDARAAEIREHGTEHLHCFGEGYRDKVAGIYGAPSHKTRATEGDALDAYMRGVAAAEAVHAKLKGDA